MKLFSYHFYYYYYYYYYCRSLKIKIASKIDARSPNFVNSTKLFSIKQLYDFKLMGQLFLNLKIKYKAR